MPYWLPLLTGRTAMHLLAVPAFWLVFGGFNLTFFMMHLTGLRGMPRRIYTYSGDEGWTSLNLLSSVFQVSPQGDGFFNVEMTTAGGQFRTIPGFSSEHEAAAWIVQTQRLLQQATRDLILCREMLPSAFDELRT